MISFSIAPIRSISIRWSASTSDANAKMPPSCRGAGRLEQVFDHRDRAAVVLDHSHQEEPIELDAFRVGELRHFFRRQHAGHEAAGLVMRVRSGDRGAAILQPLPHHVHLVVLRNLDPQAESLHVRIGGAIGDERHHFNRLRVVADHALHEFHVGSGGLDLRKVGRLRRVDGPGVLAGRARLQDPGAGRRAAAGGLACGRAADDSGAEYEEED